MPRLFAWNNAYVRSGKSLLSLMNKKEIDQWMNIIQVIHNLKKFRVHNFLTRRRKRKSGIIIIFFFFTLFFILFILHISLYRTTRYQVPVFHYYRSGTVHRTPSLGNPTDSQSSLVLLVGIIKKLLFFFTTFFFDWWSFDWLLVIIKKQNHQVVYSRPVKTMCACRK